MFDAGHTHGPTPHFVSDCPLCEAAKNARNQAIEHLSEALYLLAGLRSHDDQPTVRLNLGPVGVTGDDAQRCHSIDLSAKQAEALADAIDSMTAYVSGESPIDRGLRDLAAGIEAAIPIDEDRMAQSTARFMGWLQGQSGEAIESGEWSAAAVAQNDPDTWDAVNDAFFELDLRAVTKQVLNDTTVDNLTVNRALDDWFGDIPDPELADLYGDEDGDV
ncbi:hypothetical protein AB0M00_43485 [Streptomyces chartreusis]|uniref:hypothetical protein n=1 Tax=Streptomyces chartreusis TaxID=1969 RepID=UPI003427576B